MQETTDLFNSESVKLEDSIDIALKKSEKMSISEIVGCYFQVINVSSLIRALKQQENREDSENKDEQLSKRIEEIEKKISEKFDKILHPLVLEQLQNSIEESMNNLKSAKKGIHGAKSKDEIEKESKLYEKLREIMSTKEFVEQYNKGLMTS